MNLFFTTPRFQCYSQSISGMYELIRQPIGDQRGWFDKLIDETHLLKLGWNEPICQLNRTFTEKSGTVRGMHVQKAPHGEKKLIACLRGRVLDIAVDLRKDSKTFLNWVAIELDAEKRNSVLLPEGVAHGLQTLTDDVEMLYCHSVGFHPESEWVLNYGDPLLQISWPLPVSEISEKDQRAQFLNREFKGLIW